MSSAISKFLLYNEALTACGEQILSSVGEAREARYILDQAWDAGAVDFCLEQGLWNFATRSIQIEYSESVEPPFGFSRAFERPEDFIRTVAVCSDEFFQSPLLEYIDEAGFWFANIDTLYLRFVSIGDTYGNDLSLWPRSFAKYVALHLASQIAPKLTQDKAKKEQIKLDLKMALRSAKAKDAMAEPATFPPTGSWVRSRRGRRSGSDGGNPGTLIG